VRADTEAGETEQEQSPEEIYEAELAKEKDKFLRLFAEFENYKKRTSRERMELFKTAGQDVIASLLPVLDDFERALKEISKSSDQELFKGVELIDNKLRETLKAKGLHQIEVKEGDAFDPELHDAITQVPAPEKKLKGRVIDVIEKGFRLGEKVIRHPKVVVGN
jgi:molecular chaperone GrpE